MTDRPLELIGMSSGACSDDGKRIRFRIESAHDTATDVECAHGDIDPMIQFLIGLGGQAAARRAEVTPHTLGNTDRVAVSPIDISDLGFMQERGTGAAILIMRMFGFDLGFALSPDQLHGLKAEFERLLKGAPQPRDHGHGHGHHH